MTIETTSAEETERAAARLAALLEPGDVLCLRGNLGAGKTTFTRGLTRALGASASASSPTFTLLHEYREADNGVPVFHFDAYRLRGPADLADIGFDDYLSGNGIVVIEWPERIEAALPDTRIDIALKEPEDGGDDDDGEQQQRRRITLTPHGGISEQRRADFAAAWQTTAAEQPC